MKGKENTIKGGEGGNKKKGIYVKGIYWGGG